MGLQTVFVILLISTLYTVFSVKGQYGQTQQCGPNEFFNPCGSMCPPSCNRPADMMCSMQCVARCQCEDGYTYNSSGECVPATECW